jgi:hypothetical protein
MTLKPIDPETIQLNPHKPFSDHYLGDISNEDGNPRFYVDESCILDRVDVMDRVNPANDRIAQIMCFPGGPGPTQGELRYLVLVARLKTLFQELFCLPPDEFDEFDGPLFPLVAVLDVGVTRLACQHGDAAFASFEKCDELSKRKPLRFASCTSLALFVDDVMRVLRDLYGDFEFPAATRIRDAVFHVMGAYTRSSLKELWDEIRGVDYMDYQLYDAESLNSADDYGFVEEGNKLLHRSDRVRTNPSAFSKYTVKFVQILDENWPQLKMRKPGGLPKRTSFLPKA